MARARARGLENLNSLLRSEWENLISQANLGEENTYIARKYFLDAIPQIDIAIELNLERSTISRRLPKILDKLDRTAQKMGML